MVMKTPNRTKCKEPARHLARGQQAESQARQFLIRQGFKHLRSNYRCRQGEIDLIMEHNNYLVFVEVRYRGSNAYGGAAASLDRRKQARLRATAEHYLKLVGGNDRLCRFDVVLLGAPPQSELEWIPNAF